MSNAKPSVVMLTPDRNIDRRILLQANSLQALGWEVAIVAMPPELGTLDLDKKIIRVNIADEQSSNKNRFLVMYQYLRKHLPNHTLIRYLKSLIWSYFVNQKDFYIKYFDKIISSMSPTVFMAHDLPMLAIAADAAARCGAKLIYDSHELYCEQELSKFEKNFWKKIEKIYIGNCDVVITVNNSIAEILRSTYNISKVHVLYNAELRPQNMELTKKNKFHKIFGLPSEYKIVLFQGNLSSGRNIDKLIEAFKMITNPFIVLIILGNGPLNSTLKWQVKKMKLSRRVFFHAAVSQHELLEFSASADVGVIPYQATCLNNYYCTPNKLFEFIAAGIPVLASDLPEIRKIVLENDIGLIGDMGNSLRIAQLVEKYFNEEVRIQSWQKNVAATREHICWENESLKLNSIFENLLKSNL